MVNSNSRGIYGLEVKRDSAQPSVYISPSVSSTITGRLKLILRGLPRYCLDFILNWENLWATNSLFNTKNGLKCLVTGGGPSLSRIHTFEQYMTENFEVISTNSLDRYIQTSLKPDYVVLSDPSSIKEYVGRADCKDETLRGIFVPTVLSKGMRDQLSSLNSLTNRRIEIYRYCDRYIPWPRFRIHPLLPRSYTSMTAYKALVLAIFMGYDEIYIAGIDNTYARDTVCTQQGHLYAVINRPERSPYRPYLYDVTHSFRTYSLWLDSVADLFHSLDYISENAGKSKIYNLDPDSIVDSFEKFSYDIPE